MRTTGGWTYAVQYAAQPLASAGRRCGGRADRRAGHQSIHRAAGAVLRRHPGCLPADPDPAADLSAPGFRQLRHRRRPLLPQQHPHPDCGLQGPGTGPGHPDHRLHRVLLPVLQSDPRPRHADRGGLPDGLHPGRDPHGRRLRHRANLRLQQRRPGCHRPVPEQAGQRVHGGAVLPDLQRLPLRGLPDPLQRGDGHLLGDLQLHHHHRAGPDAPAERHGPSADLHPGG